jgi:hypothetical protein
MDKPLSEAAQRALLKLMKAQRISDPAKYRAHPLGKAEVAMVLRATADSLDSLHDFEALMTLADELDPPIGGE